MSRESYHRISSRVWLEPWDDDTRMVAFYLLTNEHRPTEGIYRLPLVYGAEDMGWPLRRFKAGFGQLCAAGFIEYDDGAKVVLIVNALKWQAPGNPNQKLAATRKLRALPATSLFDHFASQARTLAPDFFDYLTEHMPERFAKGSANGSTVGA